jgi:hypothetical protein
MTKLSSFAAQQPSKASFPECSRFIEFIQCSRALTNRTTVYVNARYHRNTHRSTCVL